MVSIHAQFQLDTLSHKMKAVSILVAVVATLLWTEVNSRPQLDARVELDDLWVNYKQTYSKVYDDDIEDSYR